MIDVAKMDATALQNGIRIVAATSEALVKDLLRRRREVRAIAMERRPTHARGNLIDIVDGIWSPKTVSVVQRLGGVGLQMNAIWVQLPPGWLCPCCHQPKENLIFLSENVAIAQAVEHHDHFGSYVNHCFHQKLGSTWSKFPSALEVRGCLAAAVVAFDATVICESCNFAEGQAKAVLRKNLGLGKEFLEYFSFSPAEIRQFIRPCTNAHHKVDNNLVLSLFEKGRKREIMKFRKDTVDVQVKLLQEGIRWRSPEASAPDADTIVDTCEDALLEFGMESGANFFLRDLSATDQGQKSDPSAWITTKFKRAALILKSQEEAFLNENSFVQEAGLSWRCACCARSTGAVIRYNNSRKLTFQTRVVRPSGAESIVCIDCHFAMINISGAAGVDRDEVTFSDVKEIFAFGSNQRHRIRSADTAHLVIEQVRSRVALSHAAQDVIDDEARISLAAKGQREARLHRRSVSARIGRDSFY